MEILKTIWTALTTENKLLFTILSAPFTFIDAFVGMLIFTTILNIPVSKKQKILYVVIFGLLVFLCRTFVPDPYGTFINMISCPICVIFIFKTGLLKAIFAEIIPFSCTIIVEIIIEKIIYVFTGIPATSLLNITLYRFLIISFVFFDF